MGVSTQPPWSAASTISNWLRPPSLLLVGLAVGVESPDHEVRRIVLPILPAAVHLVGWIESKPRPATVLVTRKRENEVGIRLRGKCVIRDVHNACAPHCLDRAVVTER